VLRQGGISGSGQVRRDDRMAEKLRPQTFVGGQIVASIAVPKLMQSCCVPELQEARFPQPLRMDRRALFTISAETSWSSCLGQRNIRPRSRTFCAVLRCVLSSPVLAVHDVARHSNRTRDTLALRHAQDRDRDFVHIG